MGKPEHRVEERLRLAVKAAGGLCLKFASAQNGVPDRIVVLAGRTLFVELKAPGGALAPIQRERIAQLREAGAEVAVLYAQAQVDEFVAAIAAGAPTLPHTAAFDSNTSRKALHTIGWDRDFHSSTKEQRI